MNSRQTPDYYAVLGVPKSATAEEIKLGYRQRAKDLHPDRNKSRDATAHFQRLQEAYSILGSPERRKLYDAGNFAAAVDPATPATEVVFEPVTCDSCGKISAQLRFVEYEMVWSVFVASYSHKRVGTFCPKCASSRLFTSSLLTGAVGWLGVHEAFWSLRALLNNSFGGERAPGINTFLLAKQAAYFHQQGNMDLAQILADEAIVLFPRTIPSATDYSIGKRGFEIAKIIANSSTRKPLRLKSKWSGWPVAGRFALLGFAIPLALWSLLFTSGGTSQSVRYVRPSPPVTQSASQRVFVPHRPAASTPPEQRMVGADGHTYMVSHLDFLRLKPIYDELGERGSLLKTKADYSDAWRQRLEAFRAQNPSMTDEQTNTFNTQIDSFNRSLEARGGESASYNRDVDAYNAGLERVGRRVN